jgi:two-component system response regulator YesN
VRRRPKEANEVSRTGLSSRSTFPFGQLSLPEESSAETHAWRELEQKLVYAVRAGERREVAAVMGELYRLSRCNCRSLEDAYYPAYRLLVLLSTTCEGMGLEPESLFFDSRHPFRLLSEWATLEAIYGFLTGYCGRIIAALGPRRLGFAERKAREAVRYVEEHYGDPLLSLPAVSQQLHISTSYLCAIFKRRTGRTFLEYLTGLRLRAAKAALRTTALKHAHIARQVGYQDEHYFSHVFKKATGLSPREYQREARGQPINS